MDQAYWDRIADRFDEEVLKILDRDRNGILRRTITQHASPRKIAADFGCGNGSLLPLLSPAFRNVIAVDHSAKLLSEARHRTQGVDNIRYVQADLSSSADIGRKVDVLFCVNVLLHPDPALRESILENAVAAMKRRGALIVIVPAFESLLHTYRTIIDINVALGLNRAEAVSEVQSVYDEEVVSPVDGIVKLGTEPTKMHTREEIQTALLDHGLKPTHCERVEYDWDEMIDDAPEGLSEPFPWDWLFVARKP